MAGLVGNQTVAFQDAGHPMRCPSREGHAIFLSCPDKEFLGRQISLAAESGFGEDHHQRPVGIGRFLVQILRDDVVGELTELCNQAVVFWPSTNPGEGQKGLPQFSIAATEPCSGGFG